MPDVGQVSVRVRFCPRGRTTFDEDRTFLRVPQLGESILRDGEGERYVVVDIDWYEDGTPFVIAHGFDRPRAQGALRYGR